MKIAIVTGASSGMGREAVIQLADRFGGGLGEIWAVARRADRLEELRSQVPVRFGFFLWICSSRRLLKRSAGS